MMFQMMTTNRLRSRIDASVQKLTVLADRFPGVPDIVALRRPSGAAHSSVEMEHPALSAACPTMAFGLANSKMDSAVPRLPLLRRRQASPGSNWGLTPYRAHYKLDLFAITGPQHAPDRHAPR